MKIKKVEFKKHLVFNNHTVIFGNTDIPIISFLVGNNGSGKTKVLDILYHALVEPFNHNGDYEVIITMLLTDQEKADLSLIENEINYYIKKDNGANEHRVNYVSSGALVPSINIQGFSKVVFSTIEVNFTEPSISSVTSLDTDDIPKPKERSENLSTKIPQLLVDISNLDDSDISKWYTANKQTGHANPFPPVGTRLERFISAFHKIYDGEKTFSGIKNESGTKKITFTDKNGNEIGLNSLSTGEKQIIYRIGYILKNLGNIHGGIILIDEPEISLHPIWQMKLKDFLLEVFDTYDVQIIIATHSPYIFKNLDETKEACIKVDRTKSVSEKISMIFPQVPYNPSVNLINYLAYGIVDPVLHIELYTLLQIREKRDHITNTRGNQDGIEDWLRDTTGGNIPIKKSFTRTGQSTTTDETIMTWIRNKIHHGDETARPDFSSTDLKESIDSMIILLQK